MKPPISCVAGVALMTILFESSHAQAVTAQCNEVLILQRQWSSSSEQLYYSWLDLITRDTYESASNSLGAAFKGFSGSFDSFSQKRESLFQQRSFVSNTARSSAALREGLSDRQVKAWENCVTQNSESPRVYLARWRGDSFDYRFHFNVNSRAVDSGIFEVRVTGGELLSPKGRFESKRGATTPIMIRGTGAYAPTVLVTQILDKGEDLIAATSEERELQVPKLAPLPVPRPIDLQKEATVHADYTGPCTPAMAIDGDPNTHWSVNHNSHTGPGAGPAEYEIRFRTPTVVTSIRLMASSSDHCGSLHEIIGEIDGRYQQIGTVSGIYSPRGWLGTNFTETSALTRLIVKSVDVRCSWIGWHEIQLSGYTVPPRQKAASTD